MKNKRFTSSTRSLGIDEAVRGGTYETRLELTHDSSTKQVGPVANQEESKMATATVIELRNLPPGFSSYLEESGIDQTKVESVELFAQWLLEWIRRFFDETQIVIDAGSDEGVTYGDYFVSIQNQTQIKGLSGEELGELEDEGSLIKVVEVRPKFSVCALEAYSYEDHLAALPKVLEQFADKDGTINVDDHLSTVGPLVVGQHVIGIPQEETAGRDAIEELYGQTLSDALSDEEKFVYYRQMIRAADNFLLSHSQGYFAPDALFQKGYAQFQLAEYQNAVETFENFIEKYPFHVSAKGARDWRVRAEQRLRRQRDMTRKEKAKAAKNHNPWVSGSFYLAAFLIVAALLLVAANTIPSWALPIVVIGALLAVSIIGAFQLRQDEGLSQKNFLELMMVFRFMFRISLPFFLSSGPCSFPLQFPQHRVLQSPQQHLLLVVGASQIKSSTRHLYHHDSR